MFTSQKLASGIKHCQQTVMPNVHCHCKRLHRAVRRLKGCLSGPVRPCPALSGPVPATTSMAPRKRKAEAVEVVEVHSSSELTDSLLCMRCDEPTTIQTSEAAGKNEFRRVCHPCGATDKWLNRCCSPKVAKNSDGLTPKQLEAKKQGQAIKEANAKNNGGNK